jgi:hypothetical protein
MDKKEAKKLGAWISLLAGTCFLLGAIAAVYIMFYMKPETGTYLLVRLGRLMRKS